MQDFEQIYHVTDPDGKKQWVGRGILNTVKKKRKCSTALARITLFDFILAIVGHKNPSQST